jgi:type IV secretory pathway TraG/TraD family ATPase VirD4
VEAVTNRSQLDLADLTRRSQLLVVGAPMQGGRLAEATSGLLFGQLMQRLYRGFRTPGHHVFFVIDEAARLTNRLNFEEILTVARSAGVSVCLALQDVAQLKDEDERSAILSNCAAFVAFNGVSPLTAKTLGDRLGERPIAMSTVNRTNEGWGRSTSFGQSVGQGPVLGAREIMAPPFGAYSAVAHINAPAQGISSKPVVVSFA